MLLTLSTYSNYQSLWRFNALGGLTAPLINKKAIQANFAQADALQIEALYNYDKTLLTAFIETSTLQSKISNIKLLQQF